MKAKGRISRNPADYGPQVHAIVRSMAKHFFDGDEQKAWEYFFDYYETHFDNVERLRKARSQGTARLHLGLLSNEDELET